MKPAARAFQMPYAHRMEIPVTRNSGDTDQFQK